MYNGVRHKILYAKQGRDRKKANETLRTPRPKTHNSKPHNSNRQHDRPLEEAEPLPPPPPSKTSDRNHAPQTWKDQQYTRKNLHQDIRKGESWATNSQRGEGTWEQERKVKCPREHSGRRAWLRTPASERERLRESNCVREHAQARDQGSGK